MSVQLLHNGSTTCSVNAGLQKPQDIVLKGKNKKEQRQILKESFFMEGYVSTLLPGLWALLMACRILFYT